MSQKEIQIVDRGLRKQPAVVKAIDKVGTKCSVTTNKRHELKQQNRNVAPQSIPVEPTVDIPVNSSWHDDKSVVVVTNVNDNFVFFSSADELQKDEPAEVWCLNKKAFSEKYNQ